MPVTRLFLRGSLALVAAAALGACAQHGGAMLPSSSLALQGNALPLTSAATKTPPPCKGQKSFKDHASLSVTLSSNGGLFCVPAIAGFGGTLSYPKADPSAKVKITSSATDYDKLPQLGTGTAIFYLQFDLTGGTKFGSQIRNAGGITSEAVVTGKPYTAFGQATVGSSKEEFGPCSLTAIYGKYGGVLRSVGGLFEYGVVPPGAQGFIEIYSGKQTNTKC
jgi:hypothetical protein